MKNKEKFAKEILDIVCNGDEVAMDDVDFVKVMEKAQRNELKLSWCYVEDI